MSTFRGFVKEFPGLAIDYFRPRDRTDPSICAYLLSHTHSDHLQGLESKNFGGAFIYCSKATKSMLLATQDVQSRTKFARGEIAEPVYKYKHLCSRSHDLLRVLDYHCPTSIQVGFETVVITMFDANHCPGSSMFLIETRDKAVLYTGDMRAEPTFLRNLLSNPLLSAYTSGVRHLDCIYLDTSARPHGPTYPTKAEACARLIESISQYPETTSFYLNARCTGYEDLFIAINRALGAKIHVDDYRKRLYKVACEDWEYGRLLDQVLTSDSGCTRFHACESIDPCTHRLGDEQEVYIKIVNHVLQQESEQEQTRHEPQSSGLELPRIILVPFARHSDWSELVEFVKALRPKSVHTCVGDVNHLFNSYCAQNRDTLVGIKHYEQLVQSGLWHQGSRCIRQRLMQDIII